MPEGWTGLVETIGQELPGMADLAHMARGLIRLTLAALLGAWLGAERERQGKAAGLRTHILVALGAAIFVLVPQQLGMPIADLSRVIQGIATGIGFLGAGTILKLTDERDIQGLTTAAGIWMTAAIGVAAGVGRPGVAFLATLFAWIVLSVLQRFEPHEQPPGS